MPADLAVIVISFNTADLLCECLSSVFANADALTLEVWVVDNASTDSSLEAVERRFPQVKLIANTENVGFAKANNQALSRVSARHTILLNSDTVIQSGALTRLVQALDEKPQTAAIGPLLINPDGSIQPSAGAFPSLWSTFLFQTFLFRILPSPIPVGRTIHPAQRARYQRPHAVDWVTGAAMIMQGKALADLGGLDERNFMYTEDLLWCWKAKQAGYQIEVLPSASVMHHQSSGRHRDYRRWIMTYSTAMLAFFAHYRGIASLRAAAVLTVIGSLIRIPCWIVYGLVRRQVQREAWERSAGYRDAAVLALKVVLQGANALP